MELNQTIRKITFLFFIATGMVHFVMGMMSANGYLGSLSGLIHKTLYTPFAISAVLYLGSIVRETLLRENKHTKTYDYVLIGLVVVIFFGLIGVEYLLPSS